MSNIDVNLELELELYNSWRDKLQLCILQPYIGGNSFLLYIIDTA